MELRRAILLFAIVLGLAAIASSVTRPRVDTPAERPRPARAAPSSPTADERVGEEPQAPVTFDVRARRSSETRSIDADRPGVVAVKVPEPGEVELPALGLTATAEPRTPARFEVFASTPGRYPVRFRPVRGESRTVGVLQVTP